MADNFVTYQTFISAVAAADFTALLNRNNIPYESENNDNLGASFIGFHDGTHKVEIKINKANFPKVDALYEQMAKEQLPLLEQDDYYLLSYTKEELLEVISEPDNWSKLDYYIARLLLSEKHELQPGEAEALKQQRIEQLAEPEKNQSKWIKRGYILAITGGLGFIIGMVICNHKKTLPDGNMVYAYSEQDRKHGKMIIRLSLIALIIYAAVYLYNYMNGTPVNIHHRSFIRL